MYRAPSQYLDSCDIFGFVNFERVPFMGVIHSFWDESGKFKDHKIVSMCGVCAPEDKFQEFDRKWKELLRRYEIPWLSMKEATRTRRAWGPLMPANQPIAERIEALKPFADCIIQYIELGILIGVDVGDHKRVWGENNPHYLAFFICVSALVRFTGDDDKITIICDDDEETALTIFRFYRKFRIAKDDARKKWSVLLSQMTRTFPLFKLLICFPFWFSMRREGTTIKNIMPTNPYTLCLQDHRNYRECAPMRPS